MAQQSHVVDCFYQALGNKDLAGAQACCTPDAEFWHNFDAVAQTLEQASQGWSGMFQHFQQHRVVDIERQILSDESIVQRHLFLLAGEDGVLKGKACCIFVSLEQGLIKRLDEYINLAGDLTVDQVNPITAGLVR